MRSPCSARAFRESDGLVGFLTGSGLLASGIAATVGTASLALMGSLVSGTLRSVWFTWWIGDAVSVWTLVPVMVVGKVSLEVLSARRILFRPWRLAEFLGVTLILLFGSLVTFGGILPGAYSVLPTGFANLPAFFWLALRFRPLGISLGLFAHFAIAVWGASRGFGSYARMPEGYLLLQLYMATRVFFFQLPAVLTIVRQRAIEDLRASRQRIHDFNNLLTTVNGYSDLILHAPPGDASIPDHAREIRAAGTRAADLTLQLLTFSRQDVVQPLVFDLNGLVADRERWLVSLLCDGFHLGLTLAGSEGDCSRPGAQGPGA